MALSAFTNYHAILPNKRATQLPFSFPSKSQSSITFSLHKPTTVLNEYRRRRLFNISASAVSGTPAGIESSVVDENSKIEKALDRVEVFDLNGTAIPISDLWKDRKAVVAFARHFGCVLCRKRADLLASNKEQMDAAGVALILIGPGSVDQKLCQLRHQRGSPRSSAFGSCSYLFLAGLYIWSLRHHIHPIVWAVFKARVFSQQTKFKGEVYADPSYSSYGALEFVSGISTTFTPKAGLKIIQLYMEGYRQDWELSFEKDTRERGGWQQGGIIVAGPGKSNISYIHKDKEAGDDPPIEDVLKACCA